MTRLPLEHIRIIDLTQAWAGSYALQLLGDFGAEVIKVESRSRPDPWRGGFQAGRGLGVYPTDGPGERSYNRAYLANSVNRNKYGITLDLSTDPGRDAFLAIVATADVVTENFTPRVLGNLGIAYETLNATRPGIILLSMPAFGTSGPYSEYPGIGGTVEPMSANAWLLGEPGGEPQVSGVMYPDAIAGLNGACAVLTALRRRESTGMGCHVEVSQQESMIAMLGEFFAHGELSALGRQGNRDLAFAPNGIYPCREGGWIAVSARSDSQWESLIRTIKLAGAEVVCDLPRFKSAAGRLAGQDELDGLLADSFKESAAAEVEGNLLSAGVPAARVRTAGETFDCPQLMAREYFAEVEQPEGIGIRPMPGIIARLARTPGNIRLPPVRHGEHSREVLSRILHLADDELDRLEAAGIIGTGPPP